MIRIYFDGEARPNRWNGLNRICVVVVRSQANERIMLIDEAAGNGDAEKAEWKALIRAAEIAATFQGPVAILGDCLVIIDKTRSITSRNKSLQRYREIVGGAQIDLSWVPRGENLAGRWLEAGDGQYFRNGVAAFEDRTPEFDIVADRLALNTTRNAYQRARRNRKNKARMARRHAEARLATALPATEALR